MRRKIILLAIVHALVILNALVWSGARVYNGENKGVAWDWGGVEIVGDPGIFLCANDYEPSTGQHWHNPLSDVWPSMVVDC